MKCEQTQRAAELIEADPEQSDGMIAVKVGLCFSTIRRLRKAMDACFDVDVRLGLDGKMQRVRS